jgi:hypothetical protein
MRNLSIDAIPLLPYKKFSSSVSFVFHSLYLVPHAQWRPGCPLERNGTIWRYRKPRDYGALADPPVKLHPLSIENLMAAARETW